MEVNRAERTRQRLQEHALRLFEERGFDNVTVEEVARAAGVSHMTFFRNFPTKESVVLDDPFDPLIGEAIARQNVDLPIVVRVLTGVLEAWGRHDMPDDESIRSRLRLASDHPSLRARVWENNRRTEDVIVGALTGTGVAEFDARVAAGAAMGALTAALLDWAQADDGESLEERLRATRAILAAGGSEEVLGR